VTPDAVPPPTVDLRCGDALEVLRTLPDESVQTCVTSPPYYGLRDYGTGVWHGGDPGCEHKVCENPSGHGSSRLQGGKKTVGHQREGFRGVCPRCGAVRVDRQIGLELTVEEYVARMVEVFREVRRVLRKDGTLWLNLGDSYAGSNMTGGVGSGTIDGSQHGDRKSGDLRFAGKRELGALKPKDLIGIPWRVAFALQADGWWLRSDIIWAKPNCMPSSVSDRPTSSHEYVFLLAKNERYFYDAEAIKEPSGPIHVAGRGSRADNDRDPAHGTRKQDAIGKHTYTGFNERWRNRPRGGRNTRSVWTIATQPFPDAHFATFPEALVERCVLAGSPPMACAACGAPWHRVIERTGALHRREAAHVPGNVATKVDSTGWAPTTRPTSEWRVGCECGAGTAPAVVLDPFVGSGTTCAVAARLGRDSIGIDLNPDYIRMAERRVAPWVAQTRLFQEVTE
jgi:DNA modification methylase